MTRSARRGLLVAPVLTQELAPVLTLVLALVLSISCGGGESATEGRAETTPPKTPARQAEEAGTEATAAAQEASLQNPQGPLASQEPQTAETLDSAVPQPDMTDMEPQVAERLREVRAAVVATANLDEADSAAAWGRFGMVAHAHELWEEARIAYQRAQDLDPSDVRWPYYLGDVRSVLGDLESAARALRRALTLRPDYAPAHMRLGRVLMLDDQPEAAAAAFDRALELEPELQPAQVALAQIELARGELAKAEKMLEEVLGISPRHAQALSTLGQIYMRQGRRDEARKIATRARDAAIYNLFSDPLMGQVVLEGVSSVLLWERAKAFFDNGNFEQAALGLAQVVKLQPENADARHQLAIAYGNIEQPARALEQLEHVVELRPDFVDARAQLATLYLEAQRPGSAIPHLRRALELAPEDPDAGWLLARAELQTGVVQDALDSFEKAAAVAKKTRRPVPSWAHNEWGSALAQSGHLEQALGHFRTALDANPDDAQALFFTGLVFEGLGRVNEAVASYCHSMRAQPNPPAAGRLDALQRTCG